MRSLLSLAVLLASLLCARAADTTIASVRPHWRDAESFDRISEYFNGTENTGDHRILRTHSEVRAGYYFLVRLAPTAALADARFELQVIGPDSPTPKTFTFSAKPLSNQNIFELGLTGADWPGGAKTHPIAWRLAVLAADGHLLAEQRSFLWEMPAK